MGPRNGYHQNEGSAWIGASSARSSWVNGRSTSRLVVSVGIPGPRRIGSGQRQAGGLGQRRVAPGAGLRRVELVGTERAHGPVAGAAADDLDPLLARLAVGDMGHELPRGAAQTRAVHLHRVTRPQPGPAGGAAEVSHGYRGSCLFSTA